MDNLVKPFLASASVAGIVVVDGSFWAGFFKAVGAPLTWEGLGNLVGVLVLGGLSLLAQNAFRSRARLLASARDGLRNYLRARQPISPPSDAVA